jgi:hypothetical protein
VSFSLLGAKLYKGDGLQIVRGDSNEVGVSYDQNSVRHYFFFGKAPVAQKFSIKLTVWKTKGKEFELINTLASQWRRQS